MSSAEVSVNGQSGPIAGAPGRGARVTVPVSLAPDDAARESVEAFIRGDVER